MVMLKRLVLMSVRDNRRSSRAGALSSRKLRGADKSSTEFSLNFLHYLSFPGKWKMPPTPGEDHLLSVNPSWKYPPSPIYKCVSKLTIIKLPCLNILV